MQGQTVRVLLVEDNEVEARLLAEVLYETYRAMVVAHAETMAAAECHLAQASFDAVLLDLSLPDSRGLDTLERVLLVAPHVPILVFTGLDDEAAGTEAIRRGAQDYLIKGQADGEILLRAIRYAVERKRAEEEIRKLNAELEERVAERTAVARQRASQLRALASQLTSVEQRERRRLAQVLHDHLQQLLVAMRMKLSLLRRRTEDDASLEMVEQIDEMLDESIQASRSLTVELSPPVLYEGGLGPALDWLANHVRDRHGLSVSVDIDAELGPINEDTRVLLFSAVRELLFNVAKHAGVTDARVQVRSCGDDEVCVVVSDEGAGFDTKAVDVGRHNRPGGFGLFSVRQRLELLGGRFQLDSDAGRGTRVNIWAPRQPQMAAV